MQIFLPIAEVSVNAFTLVGLGGIVGLMSGLFGVGGGFLITPLLFFIGIPPAIAVATGANQVVASSFSGVLAHLRRNTVDIRMGLVLLVGSTGSGKSTTLASMIDHRNNSRTGHILTIEDPIEFLHRHKRSIVNQREVGMDTHSFHVALKNAMREAPDVILIGEIRDAETMEAAIAFAETGHLCLATLHSNNADQTIERILNFFPEGAHKNVLMNLALNMRAIVSQRLVAGIDGKRRPAAEVLINTPHIRDLLRRGQVHEMKQAMEESLEEGMETFDQCLFRLYKEGHIEMEEALNAADSRDGLALKFRLSEGHGGEHDPYADVFTAGAH